MNKVILIGRLVSDPELKYTGSNKPYSRVSLAVSRDYAKDGDKITDFINCIFWGHLAETLNQYQRKGNKICVVGSIQTGKYTKDDESTLYTTDILVNQMEFLENKTNEDKSNIVKEQKNIQTQEEKDPFADFGKTVTLEQVSEIDEDSLPF